MIRPRRATMRYSEPITPGGDPLFISFNAGELASLVLPRKEWELLGNAEELTVTIEAVEVEPATEEFPPAPPTEFIKLPVIETVQPRTGGLPRL